MANKSEMLVTGDSEARLLSESQLLARFPVSRPTLRKLRINGHVPYVSVGKRVFYDWPSFRDALLRQERFGKIVPA
jgi:hypothetical protein